MSPRQKQPAEDLKEKIKSIPDPQPYDIVLAIIGMTGSGKSTLINTLSNNTAGLVVGHDLDSCTESVQYVFVTHPQVPTHRIVFLDTPGLNTTNAPDIDVLKKIVSYFKASYQDTKLAGVIFLYEIIQTRDISLARKDLDQFEILCGEAATQNVILATTKWTTPPKDGDLQREEELRGPQHWGHLIRRGFRICRLDDLSYEAAWKLINLSLVDAFTFDTEKIKDDVKVIKETLKHKGDGHRLITTLEELLISQNKMAMDMKRGGGLTDVLWNQLVENDRHIRDTLKQLNTKVPLSQKFKSFFKFKFDKSVSAT